VIQIDAPSGLALLVSRDDTGKIIDQFPSKKVANEYQKQMTIQNPKVRSTTLEFMNDESTSPKIKIAV